MVFSRRRVITPSMPKPLMAAWNRSAFDSRLQVTITPEGSMRSKSSTWSPKVPTRKLFLPWMFMAAQPAMVVNMVPLTTAGQWPSQMMERQSFSMVTPGSTSAMPVAGSHDTIWSIPLVSSTMPSSLIEASP